MAEPESVAIRVAGVRKRFGAVQALDGVSLAVPPRSVFCILGPNGAGKTTLLRILTTITRPDEGTVSIEGHDIQADTIAVRHLIGIVAQDNHFDRYLSIWDNLTMHAQMHGLPRAHYEPRVRELLERVGLYARRHDLTDNLSGGMQRRVALIRALIHNPRVLFLDEPTTGLDPEARREIWDTVREIKREATVILTTHYMEEADVLSDRILMLHHGRVMMTGTARELKQAISPENRYEILFRSPCAATCRADIAAAAGTAGVLQVTAPDDYRLELSLATPDDLRAVLGRVDMAEVLRVGPLEADLEAVFLSVAGKKALPLGEEAS